VQDSTEVIVKVAFSMVVGNLIDSEIMQLLPISFAKNLVNNLLGLDEEPGKDSQASMEESAGKQPSGESIPYQQSIHQAQPPTPQGTAYNHESRYMHQNVSPQDMQRHDMSYAPDGAVKHTFGDINDNRRPVNVQPAQFEAFDDNNVQTEKENISLIMDVPLEVTVELGRTRKLIREILEFGTGSIIELDKLAGEPVDILVNGKPIAKGEVVVIDENFGVRITDIVQHSKRL